jgi:DHA1 family tetracycline resistance protein-like MFS transporter
MNADTPTPPTSPSDAPAAPAKYGPRAAMMIVFLVVFIDLLGFGIVLPLLPRIAESYVLQVFPKEGNAAPVQDMAELARANPLAGFIVGMLMSSFSLMQFLFAPVWGRLSDRIGRRPILLIGLFGSVVFYSLFGYAASLKPDEQAGIALLLFFVARIGAGISGATISTAMAVVADCTPPDKRKHGMALIGAAFGIGFTFGPLIGFGCMRFNPGHYELIGYTAAGMSLLALLLGLALLRETRIFGKESTVRRHLFDWSATRHVLTDGAIFPVILTFFIASLGFGAFEVTLSLFLKDNFGFLEADSFLIFAYVGFVLMLTQGFLYRRLATRWSEATLMAIGIGFMALGVALMGGISFVVSLNPPGGALDAAVVGIIGHFASRGHSTGMYAALFTALTAAVVGFAFLTPSAQALISRRTSADRQGEVLGVNQSASAMARILGPLFGVTLYKSTDTHLLPYIAGAILLLLMLPMLPRIRRGDNPP